MDGSKRCRAKRRLEIEAHSIGRFNELFFTDFVAAAAALRTAVVEPTGDDDRQLAADWIAAVERLARVIDALHITAGVLRAVADAAAERQADMRPCEETTDEEG